MHLKITKLEDRILFDASAAAVVGQVVTAADASGDGGIDSSSADAQVTQDSSQPHENADASPDADLPVTDAKDPVNVLLVSSRVDNAQQLADSKADGVVVVLYDAENASLSDIIGQIETALAGQLADSIAFATHGQSGLFHLTQDQYVSADTLTKNADIAQFWVSIGEMMDSNGRIDLLGCRIAGTDFGLIDALETLSDADVAASADMTGNGDGQNWVLESGDVNAIEYFNIDLLNEWSGSLATYTVMNTDDSGAGSLRQAILDANANAGADIIDFDLDVSSSQVIALLSNLPSITEAVTIDGSTADNYAFGTNMVVLDGFSGDILTLDAINITITGLNLISGGEDGVQVSSNADSFTITNNLIGLNLSGAASANASDGIEVLASFGLIEGNVISGNSSVGINLASGSSDNEIQGNIIGLAADGQTEVANLAQGILLLNSHDNLIGGTSSGEGNIISGNNSYGIAFINGSGSNNVEGNIIGLAADGDTIRSNFCGIFISTGANNVIGSLTDPIGGRNIISGSNAEGIQLFSGGTTGNIFVGNYIGTDITGLLDRGNGADGMRIDNGVNGTNTFGGDRALGLGNVFSGNNQTGIEIRGGIPTQIFQGNIIGLGADGVTPVGNSSNGLALAGAGMIIGGAGTLGNIISSNGSDGLQIDGNGVGYIIQGNYIGTDITGTLDRGNGGDGIEVNSGNPSLLVGGLNAGEGNVLSGNLQRGIVFAAGVSLSEVYGNFIGTNASGTAAIGNDIGGISVGTNASNNMIGSSTNPIAGRNIVSGNNGYGIQIRGTGENVIYGNYIGRTADGFSSLGNSGSGILIFSGSSEVRSNLISSNSIGVSISSGSNNIIESNTIGGSTTLLGNMVGVQIDGNSVSNSVTNNIIANSVSQGVVITGVGSFSNTVLDNSIYSNVGAAIELFDGANNGLENPIVYPPFFEGTSLKVTGLVFGPPATDMLVQLFWNESGLSSSSAQYLYGEQVVTTNSPAAFSFTITGGLPSSASFFTVTATNISTGDTSGISNNGTIPSTNPPLRAEPELQGIERIFLKRSERFDVQNRMLLTLSSRGFPDITGINQLTSFGNLLGFNNLDLMGNSHFGFRIVDQTPTLLNRDLGLGYGKNINPVGYAEGVDGMQSKSREIQDMIEGLLEAAAGKSGNTTTDIGANAKELADNLLAWFSGS